MVFTLFSVPKPFTGHIGVIQYNAIRSWVRLGADHQIILYGSEEGTADAARQLGVEHDPEVRLSEYGTPLVGDIFERAQQRARFDWLCYINCDVIAMSDLARAVRQISQTDRPVFMSGRRWHVRVDEPLDFDAGWEDAWRQQVLGTGERDSVQCMDYFVFPRGLLTDIPDFTLGRGRWDSYLPQRARELGARFVDASDAVLVAHQDHAFAHPDGKKGLRHGPEGQRNETLADGKKATLGDASHKLTDSGLKPAIDLVRLRWWLWKHRDRPIVGFPVRKLIERDKQLKARFVR